MYRKFLGELKSGSFHNYLQKDKGGQYDIEGKKFDAEGLANELKNFAKPKYQGYVNGYSEQERATLRAGLLDGNSTFIGHFIKFLRKTGSL